MIPRILLSVLVLLFTGCDTVARLNPFKPRDPVVGTWREVGDPNGGKMTFHSDGTYRIGMGRLDPLLDKEVAATMKA
jgi:hypothetical protein